jgi:L-ascorbate metabolism protein UlaG (beta-lactamase superfamily)
MNGGSFLGVVRISAWVAALHLLATTGCQVQGHQGAASSPATARYLANAGVLVSHGDTKIVFDPLFRNDFGSYQLLPEKLERALFEGAPPFDGLDAVLISHYHEDHFSPADVLRLLKERPQIRLYAPAQAVAGMRAIAGASDGTVFERVREIALEYQDAPITIEEGDLLIEAVRIPHSGWPEARRDVQNIAYRVTLDADTTVLHLGDADTSDVHFAHDADYWDRRHTDMAFPPYWYFQSEEGRGVLEHRLRPGHAVGVHVPVDMPRRREDRPADLEGFDLFVEPGETRDIPK